MLTLVEVYTTWAGTCVPMSAILTKLKVDMQVKQGDQKLHEKLQFASACSDTIKVGNTILYYHSSYLFSMGRHWRDLEETVNLSGFL